MISIIKATEEDCSYIVEIGKVSVAEAHKNSCPTEALDIYIGKNYNEDAIKKELSNTDNLYHIIKYNEKAVGFSKIILNSENPDLKAKNISKLDRIYLLKQFQGLKLGIELLHFNIALSEKNKQSGVWLYTWIGNARAIDFYLKAGFKIDGSHKFFVTKTHYNLNHLMFLPLDDK